MLLDFFGEVWFWRGPAPWYFVSVPPAQCDDLKAVAGIVTYGWGMIPVRVRIGRSEYKTSLWPKDGGYIVPIKASVRAAESIDEGSVVHVHLEVGAPPGAVRRR